MYVLKNVSFIQLNANLSEHTILIWMKMNTKPPLQMQIFVLFMLRYLA